MYIAQGDACFSDGDYIAAARLYGKVSWALSCTLGLCHCLVSPAQSCSHAVPDLVSVTARQALILRPLSLVAALQVTAASPSFEEVALKFVDVEDLLALQAFLQAKLASLGKGDKAQVHLADSLPHWYEACIPGIE